MDTFTGQREPKETELLIAITGRNRAGKTTLAKKLQEKIERLERIPFALPLKLGLIRCGFPQEFLEAKSNEARRLMQAWGDARRALNPLVFLEEWRDLIEVEEKVVADDLYHLLEYDELKYQEAKKKLLILVIRQNLPPLTDEDMKYKSVSEAMMIQNGLLSYFGDEPFKRIVRSNDDMSVFFVANVFDSGQEYEKYLEEKVVPTILTWVGS